MTREQAISNIMAVVENPAELDDEFGVLNNTPDPNEKIIAENAELKKQLETVNNAYRTRWEAANSGQENHNAFANSNNAGGQGMTTKRYSDLNMFSGDTE